jgi:hypothetical protein
VPESSTIVPDFLGCLLRFDSAGRRCDKVGRALHQPRPGVLILPPAWALAAGCLS